MTADIISAIILRSNPIIIVVKNIWAKFATAMAGVIKSGNIFEPLDRIDKVSDN